MAQGKGSYIGTKTVNYRIVSYETMGGQNISFDFDSEGKYYIISSAAELIALSNHVNGYGTTSGKRFVQTKDITLSESFNPIGTDIIECSFRGTYDGSDYTISGLNINSNNKFVGLFGACYYATVKNVRLLSPIVKSTYWGQQTGADVSSLVGYSIQSTIDHCIVVSPTLSTNDEAPILESKTDTSITVKTAAGQIYSIDGGKNWQASGTFTGLAPETEYSIVTKVSETSTSYESAVSETLKVTTDKKADPSTPTTGPGSTTTPTGKPDDTAVPGSTTSPTVQPSDTATPGGTAAPGSTETPDAGKKPAAKGTVLVDAGKTATYVVTSADAKHPTIAYKKCRNKKAKTVTIPKTVKIGGVTYTVTSIAANAFKNHKTLTKVTIGDSITTIGKNAFYGCKKLKTVTIGKNVTKIGKKAFYGCGKLKKITVKTKKLTLKNVGKSAFSGIYIRASVIVPGDKRKEYALLFKKRGIGKKVKIKTK